MVRTQKEKTKQEPKTKPTTNSKRKPKVTKEKTKPTTNSKRKPKVTKEKTKPTKAILSDFVYLDKMDNLVNLRKKETNKNRHPGLPDGVTEKLDQCMSVSAMAYFASQIGICKQEIKDMATSSINFGMFRMRIGGRIRIVLKRMTKAESNNKKITKEQAAYPPDGKYDTKWIKK